VYFNHLHTEPIPNDMFIPPPKPKSLQILPMCPQDKKCTIVHWKSVGSTREAHIRQYKHTCIWGVDCKNKNDPKHEPYWEHVALPRCPDLEMECGLLDDPDHREKYYHDGMWNFMIPCKAPNCNGKCDRHKFYHKK